MIRETIVLHTEVQEIIKDFTPKQKADLFDAILGYARETELPEMDAVTKVVFSMVRQTLDKDIQKYDKRCEQNRENIRKRWHQDQKEKEPESVPKEAKEGNKKDVKVRQHKFQPPTAAEVRQYCESEGYPVNAEDFVDYYAARGWELTKGRKMQDWKACVRTWVRKDKEWRNGESQRSGTVNEQQRSGYGDFERSIGLV